jgi:hypothetical protein
MAVSDLFLAVLAMDAYNRGYNNGVVLTGNQLGNATPGADSSILGTGADSSVGFFAQAYTLTDGQTLISYRGTDSNLGLETPILSGDLANGYGLATGNPYGPQASLAIGFYKNIAGSNLTFDQLHAANIILTGHSLGGGLAGFVAALYGKQATLFDNMPFEAGAANGYGDAHTLAVGNIPSVSIPMVQAFWQSVYGSSAPVQPDLSGLHGFSVTGEFLTALRLRQTTPVTSLDSYSGFATLNPFTQLHSEALLVLLKYAQENSLNQWIPFSPNLMPVLFNQKGQDAGSALGLQQFAGPGANGDLAGVLRDMIAYSVIDTGPADTSARQYRSAGVRSYRHRHQPHGGQ